MASQVRSATPLGRWLLIVAAVLGVCFVFTTTATLVGERLTGHAPAPPLATAEDRSFPVLAIAPGVLQLGKGTAYVLRAAFSQTEDVQLRVGQPATVTDDAIPGVTIPAKVSSVDTSATQVGGVPEYFAEIQLGTSDPRLSIGQTGSASVTLAPANNMLSVPSTALFTGANDQTQVDVWSGGHAYATTVEIGLVGNTLTQITSGLQAGDQVMLSPAGATH